MIIRSACDGATNPHFLLNVWLGGRFYFWVRHFETGGQPAFVAAFGGRRLVADRGHDEPEILPDDAARPHAASGGLVSAGDIPAIAFLFRKAFCSWLCPVGTISEYLWRAGKKFLGNNLRLPAWLDIPLRGLKYLLLGFFVWAVSSMSAGAIGAFMRSPYGIVADVKMLNFFRFTGETGRDRPGCAGDGFGAGAELLVPLPLPVRGAAGHHIDIQSLAYPP